MDKDMDLLRDVLEGREEWDDFERYIKVTKVLDSFRLYYILFVIVFILWTIILKENKLGFYFSVFSFTFNAFLKAHVEGRRAKIERIRRRLLWEFYNE